MTEAAREADQLDGVTLPEASLAPVIGHARARARLDEILGAERLPNAILFSGPRGIGKATLAFALARQILARTGDESAARIEEQIGAGSHPNLYRLRRLPKDGKGFYTVIRVEDVRKLREDIRMTRGRAGFRVAIIDAIDDCNPSAANAMLKTLEEPPPETVFLLVSHRPGLLLPTIRSRCLDIALRPLADADVAAVLSAQRHDVEGFDHAAALAGGRPRRGFEALALAADGALTALREWLQAPARGPAARHLAIVDLLLSEAGGAETGFAEEQIIGWIADEAREAALAGPGARRRLASANELWENAHALFADAESLNLDPRQTLVGVLDAIRNHALKMTSVPELS